MQICEVKGQGWCRLVSALRLLRWRQWTLGERPESHTKCCALGKEQQIGPEKSEVKDRTQSTQVYPRRKRRHSSLPGADHELRADELPEKTADTLIIPHCVFFPGLNPVLFRDGQELMDDTGCRASSSHRARPIR